MQHPFAPYSELGPMLDAALAGSREVMAVYAGDFTVERKEDGSPVSVADQRAEAAILDHLRQAFPDVPPVAEEASAAGEVPKVDGRFFLVDPLDGTKEFISRNGEFTVNIALVESASPVAGVVLAPALGRAYAGGRGAAWQATMPTPGEAIDWRAIHVRAAGMTPVAVASRSHCTPETESMLRRADAGERRSIGSSLKFCLIAAGEADFYPRLGPTMEWDTAAGDAVLRAAGGLVTTLDGAALRYGKTGVPGMREFENPHFLAAGDAAVIGSVCKGAPLILPGSAARSTSG